MRIASVLTPLSDHHLALAAQTGVTDVVVRNPGESDPPLAATRDRIASYGLHMSVVEGNLPIERIKTGIDDGTQIAEMKRLIAQAADLGVEILCYNFMAGTDWLRTTLDARDRGDCKVSGFDLAEAEAAAIPGRASGESITGPTVTAEELWTNLDRFLTEIVPVAEHAGVTLAMHPDDPPVPRLRGRDRIMYVPDAFERLVSLVPSPANAIAFCQGTFSEMGIDIPATIRRLGKHIAYVHFRDVRGTAESFVETWQDNGQTDMVEAMRAYREVGFNGPMRPDHVPQLSGEDDGPAGYTMLGRLYAYGYIKGLMQATERD